MKQYPNLLLIAGTGRNSGKTSLAVRIIEKFAGTKELTGVKISPHFHLGTADLEVVENNSRFNIYLEQDARGAKDSSRLLAAGAGTVYYIEVLDENLTEAFELLMSRFSVIRPVVVESPALGNLVRPGLHLIVDHPSTVNKKKDVLSRIPDADLFIDTGRDNLEEIVRRISFNRSGWQLSH